MPDFMDRVQERAAAESEALQQRARLNNVPHGTEIEPRDCRGCGDAIPVKRLRAVPDATECITCKQLGELQGQHFMRRRA